MSDDVLYIARQDLEFHGEIGRGGFSTVFKVKLNPTERTGKQVPKTQFAAAKKLNRAEKSELKILSKLHHPNIVTLIGVADKKPSFFLILELCEIGSLQDYLSAHVHEPLPELLAYSWGEQGARAVEYIQENHVIHRDIKSSNFVINTSKNLKLTDFGLSKTSDITITTKVKGTWGWTAPEVFIEQHLSPLSDIYSYATVIWEILTRRIPLEGCEYQNVMYRVCVLKERPEIPSNCHRTIADLLQQCWKEERTERPSIGLVVEVLSKHRAEIQATIVQNGEDIRKICPSTQISIEYEGKHSPLDVCHGTTIGQIKIMLQQETQISHQQLKLFHQLQELESCKTLSDYRMEKGTTLRLRRYIRICIKSQKGSTTILETFSDESIRDVKTRIPFVEGMPAVMVRLVHNEQDLKNDNNLSHYRVKNGDTLFIRYHLDIFIKCTAGHTVPFRVTPHQTIGQIKAILQQQEQVMADQQHLIPQERLYDTLSKFTKKNNSPQRLESDKLLHSLWSQQLEDSSSLYDCDISDGDTLHMMDLHRAFTIREHLGWLPERTLVVIPSLTIADVKCILSRVGYNFPHAPLPNSFDDIRPLSHFAIKDGFTLSCRTCHY